MDDPSTMSTTAGGRARTLLPDPMGEGFMILSVQLQHLFVQSGEALETVMIPVPFCLSGPVSRLDQNQRVDMATKGAVAREYGDYEAENEAVIMRERQLRELSKERLIDYSMVVE